ncbi:thioredoxin family protein [bacterium]|nr:thioredoxin family protein [bacterium]
MRLIIPVRFVVFLIVVSCSSTAIKQEVHESHIEIINGKRMLIGEFTKEELLSELSVFKTLYDQYQPSQNAIDFLKTISNDLTIELYLGTWCPDSKRDVPPFLKILSTADNSRIHCNLHGVDRSKKDKNGETVKLGINRVPTMIFYINGQEMGRIVESPYHDTLEEDIVDILSKQR